MNNEIFAVTALTELSVCHIKRKGIIIIIIIRGYYIIIAWRNSAASE